MLCVSSLELLRLLANSRTCCGQRALLQNNHITCHVRLLPLFVKAEHRKQTNGHYDTDLIAVPCVSKWANFYFQMLMMRLELVEEGSRERNNTFGFDNFAEFRSARLHVLNMG